MPEIIFVIDIGSNSVRLMKMADGKVLYKKVQTTRLGEGLQQTGKLSQEAQERTKRCIKDFLAESGGQAYAFATAAVRSAENGRAFVSSVKEETGLDIEVISGETEGLLGVLGALGDRDGTVIDLGGASLEIVVRKDKKTVYAKSVGVGVVRAKDVLLNGERKLTEFVKDKIKEYGTPVLEKPVVAIGGTATTLGALKVGKAEYDPTAVTGTTLSLSEMQVFSEKLMKMSVEEIKKLPSMMPSRADVIGTGAVILRELMQSLFVDELTVSDADNLEGYVRYKELIKKEQR